MKKVVSVIMIASFVLLLVLSAYSESVMLGDVNEDGKIAANDARAVLRIAAQIEEADSRIRLIADVDGNGRVTAADARTVLRVSAMLDDPLGSIEITGGQTGEKTDLVSGFGMSFERFFEKFGTLTKDKTTDGTLSYSNEYIRVVSDPKMMDGGVISSIMITGGNYTIDGVYVGMTSSEAQGKLEGSGWRLSSGTGASLVVYHNGHGMLIKLSVSDGKVTGAEYCLSESLVETTTKEPATDETTTEEKTTSAGETATKEPEIIEEPENIASLPAELKAFIYGKFGFDGENYTYAATIEKNAITMYTDGDNMSVGMSAEVTGGKMVDITILINDAGSEKSNNKMYIVLENKKYYCELTESIMSVLKISPEALSQSLYFGSMDIAKVSVSSKTVTERGIEYITYDVSADGSDFTRIYMLGDEIKRIVPFQNGFQSGRIDINKFYPEIPEGKLSLNGYQEKSWLEIFGAMLTL